MRILQICSASSIGGGERHVVDLARGLVAAGHDVRFALRNESPLRTQLSEFDDAVFCFSRMRNAADAVSTSRIAAFAREHGADIIHAHVARDYPITALASRLSGVPFVLTRHVLFPLSRIHKLTLKNVAGVIAPSNAVLEKLKGEAIFASEKMELIHNGIEISRFNNLKRSPGEHITVGTVGHLAAIKGHDTFVKSAAIVAEIRPDIRFLIVGEDKSRDGLNRDKIRRLIDEKDLSGRVELAGWTGDITTALSRMDIFVSAARVEPFGLAICEAMASSLPVVATASEGALEIIEDGVNGIIVPIDDPRALADAILSLAADESERQRLGANAVKRVLESFTRDQMTKKTINFYENAVVRHSSTTPALQQD